MPPVDRDAFLASADFRGDGRGDLLRAGLRERLGEEDVASGLELLRAVVPRPVGHADHPVLLLALGGLLVRK